MTDGLLRVMQLVVINGNTNKIGELILRCYYLFFDKISSIELTYTHRSFSLNNHVITRFMYSERNRRCINSVRSVRTHVMYAKNN